MTIPSVFGKVAGAAEDLKKLDKAAKALEADMFKRFLKEASPKGGMFGDSASAPGSDIYADMGRDALADALAQKGTLGVARTIFASMAPTIIAQHRSETPHPAPTSAAPAPAAKDPVAHRDLRKTETGISRS